MKVLYLTLLVVIADQTTKFFVKGFNIPFLGLDWQGMELYSFFEVIGNFFRITFVENPGMVFGWNFGDRIILSLIRLIAVVLIFYYLLKIKKQSLLIRIPLALILGGAIGNLIDRTFYGLLYNYAPIFYGEVVDFMDVGLIDMNFLGIKLTRWPVFNIADVAVTVGILILFIFHKKAVGSHSVKSEKILEVPVSRLRFSESKL